MTLTTRKYFATALLSSLAALFFIVFFTGRDDSGLNTFRSECGWGYTVSTYDKVVIVQPFIPAIEGRIPFETRGDARRAGEIVLERLIKGDDPSLSREDLQKAGIRI
jgi:Domain of unknown function (DUF4907)